MKFLLAGILLFTSLCAFSNERPVYNVACSLTTKNGKLLDEFSDKSYEIVDGKAVELYQNSTETFIHTLSDSKGRDYNIADIKVLGFNDVGLAPSMSIEFDLNKDIRNVELTNDLMKYRVLSNTYYNYIELTAKYLSRTKPHYGFPSANFTVGISFQVGATKDRRIINCQFTELEVE